MRILDAAPASVAIPLVAATYAAPLSFIVNPDFALWLVGPTGSLKSELAALAQRHFGTFDRKTLPPEKQPAPYVVLHHIEVEPDAVTPWPPAQWQADVGDVKGNTESAKRLLGLWIERAWRRPVGEAEREPFLKLYQKQRDAGGSFDDALRAAFPALNCALPMRGLCKPGDHSRS
jgi:hypothetical protein